MHTDLPQPDAAYAYRPARGRAAGGRGGPQRAFDRDGHALLRALRERRRPDPRLRWISLVLVLLLHMLLGWWLFVASRPYPINVTRAPGEALIVRLISAARPLPPPPAITLPPPLTAPVPTAHAPPRPAPPAARPAPPAVPTPSSTPAGTLRLYSPDGNLVLPESTAPPPIAAFAAQAPRANVDLNPRTVIAPPRHTVFSNAWVPKNENLLQKYVRKTMQEVTLPVRLPGNTRVKCVILPFPPGGSCGIVGPKQLSHFTSPKNANTIQSLPEQPLVPGMGVPLPPASSVPAPAASVPPQR
ncbi:MAG: hypothetical protein M0P72_06450 [Metallibacterium scheffleri]|jgi:hypothetical protein|uniref:hypothetical protein n=1 Tax=Metallibacterium scheffleri TaxID=993689 RepID=UPI0026F2E0A6|nr:hypothetical protein [Metallibacterium scheffleri]MCK9366771.1 hypothetical protein [Metallibacterium scheffleri]